MTSLSGNPPDDRDANDRDANHALALRIEFSRPDGGKPEIIAAIPSTRQRVAVKGDRGGKKKARTLGSGLIHQRRRVEETSGVVVDDR
jgi:hypothetical protein